jgi:acyl dehydratase
MKLMIAYRHARVAAGAEQTQENYVSPGFREMKWLKPVRPGMTITIHNERIAKRDWKSLPQYGCLKDIMRVSVRTAPVFTASSTGF